MRKSTTRPLRQRQEREETYHNPLMSSGSFKLRMTVFNILPYFKVPAIMHSTSTALRKVSVKHYFKRMLWRVEDAHSAALTLLW